MARRFPDHPAASRAPKLAATLASSVALLSLLLQTACSGNASAPAATAPVEPARASAPAAVETPEAVGAKLIEHLETFTRMELAKTPAKELTAFLFWPEAVLTGEGVVGAARGLEQLEALVAEAGSGFGECHHAIVDPTVVSGTLASQFIEYTCEPGGGKPPITARVLYVWEKRGDDWKVIRELWGSGALR